MEERAEVQRSHGEEVQRGNLRTPEQAQANTLLQETARRTTQVRLNGAIELQSVYPTDTREI